MGAGQTLIACAELVMAAGHRIVHLVGRSPDCRRWAEQRQLSCCDGHQADFRLPPCDYLLSIANDRILRASELADVQYGAFNCHNSLLPAYRGAFAASWALLDDRQTHGASWHRVTAQIDAGKMLVQSSFPIAPDDTAQSLNRKSLDLGIALLHSELLPAMARRQVVEHSLPPAEYYPVKRRSPWLGLIPWQSGTRTALRHLRALDRGPIDNSFDLPKVLVDQSVWLIGRAEPVSAMPLAPGAVQFQTDSSALLGTCDGALRLSGLRRPTPLPGGPPVNIAPAVNAHAGALLPDEAGFSRVETLATAAASSENHMVQQCQSISSEPIDWSGSMQSVPAARWDQIADRLLRLCPRLAGRTIQLATPGLELRAQTTGCKALFHSYGPFAVPVGTGIAQLAERLRAHDERVPALVDVADRRRGLIDCEIKETSFVAIVPTSADKWSIVC